jgi:hypothetical protein
MLDESLLNAPIPGMSLTTEPGNRPWENPPQLTTVEEAVEFYTDRVLDPEKADSILNPLVEGVSVEQAADYLTTSAVMNGIHTIDISILITPVIKEMIRYVADSYGVEYKESLGKQRRKDTLPSHEIKAIVKEAAQEHNLNLGFNGTQKDNKEKEEMPVRKGLMAKNSMIKEGAMQ